MFAVAGSRTRYEADRSLDEAKETASASRYGHELDPQGTQYKADTNRGIATEAQQFGRENLLDKLRIDQYIGNLEQGTQRSATDIGANTARYGADTSLIRFDALAEALGLKYRMDRELEGLGITSETARDVARIEAESERLPGLLRMIRFQKLLSMMAPMLTQFGSIGTPQPFQPQAG